MHNDSLQNIQAYLYKSLLDETHGSSSYEGIPHLVFLGLSARVELDDKDAKSFCELAGYKNGHTVSHIRFFGGYVWDIGNGSCSLQERSVSYSACYSETPRLLNKLYDGRYVHCHEAVETKANGERVANNR